MRRRLLIALTAVASVIVSLGAVNVFAAVNDYVLTETNRVSTAAQPVAVDLRVAPRSQGSDGLWRCGPWTDEAMSPLFTLDATHLRADNHATFCLRNDGATRVDLSTTVQDIVDIDVECTGDEVLLDPTCGPGPDGQKQPGELTKALQLLYFTVDCDTNELSSEPLAPLHPLGEQVAKPVSLGSLDAGLYNCYLVALHIEPSDLQAAQTDTVTWRFRFGATMSQ